MAAAQASPNANVIIAQAIDGNAAPLNFTAPAFTLTDQDGRQVSLASLHGKVVLLTFLDPVCTSDCPLIAQEFRAADQVLGGSSRHVELVAIVANPVYRSTAYTRAFDSQEGLSGVPNWLYLTGSLGELQQAWKQYGIAAQIVPAGGMVAHNDVAFVIDASGHTRTELNFDPGPGTASSKSSFAAELAMAGQAGDGVGMSRARVAWRTRPASSRWPWRWLAAAPSRLQARQLAASHPAASAYPGSLHR